MLTNMEHIEDDGNWITLNITYPTKYRKVNGIVYVSMRLTGGSTPNEDENLGTLPVGYRPTTELAVPTQNLRGMFSINTSGEVIISSQSTQVISARMNNYMAANICYPV